MSDASVCASAWLLTRRGVCSLTPKQDVLLCVTIAAPPDTGRVHKLDPTLHPGVDLTYARKDCGPGATGRTQARNGDTNLNWIMAWRLRFHQRPTTVAVTHAGRMAPSTSGANLIDFIEREAPILAPFGWSHDRVGDQSSRRRPVVEVDLPSCDQRVRTAFETASGGSRQWD